MSESEKTQAKIRWLEDFAVEFSRIQGRPPTTWELLAAVDGRASTELDRDQTHSVE